MFQFITRQSSTLTNTPTDNEEFTIHLACMFLDWRKLENPKKTHVDTGRTDLKIIVYIFFSNSVSH